MKRYRGNRTKAEQAAQLAGGVLQSLSSVRPEDSEVAMGVLLTVVELDADGETYTSTGVFEEGLMSDPLEKPGLVSARVRDQAMLDLQDRMYRAFVMVCEDYEEMSEVIQRNEKGKLAERSRIIH